jgi:hypothetical protein
VFLKATKGIWIWVPDQEQEFAMHLLLVVENHVQDIPKKNKMMRSKLNILKFMKSNVVLFIVLWMAHGVNGNGHRFLILKFCSDLY